MKNINVIVPIILVVSLFLSFSFAALEINFSVDIGELTTESQMQTIEVVPIENFFEALGVNVYWKEKTQTLIGYNENIEVILRLGEEKAIVNGEAISLEVPAQIIKGNLMVPVQFVTENLGFVIKSDENNLTVKSLVINEIDQSTKTDENKEIFEYEKDISLYVLVQDSNFKGRQGDLTSYDKDYYTSKERSKFPVRKLIYILDEDVYRVMEKELIYSFDNKYEKIQVPMKISTDAASVYFTEILSQHPEIDIKMMRTKYIHSVNGIVDFILVNYTGQYDINKINIVIDECLELMDDSHSDEEKAMIILDFISDRIEYSTYVKDAFKDDKNNERCDDYSIYTHWGLVSGDAVCEGYSKAFKIIADRAGVETKLIRGYGLGEGEHNGKIKDYCEKDINHTWIKIKLDEKWHHIDPTWADIDIKEVKSNQHYLVDGQIFKSVDKYKDYMMQRYFKLTDNEIAVDHPFWVEYKFK